MEKPQGDYQERCYYHKFEGADGKAGIYQPKLNVGLEISFDASKLGWICGMEDDGGS